MGGPLITIAIIVIAVSFFLMGEDCGRNKERRRCTQIADRQAWSRGIVNQLGPEQNSIKIRNKIISGEPL
jgi:hypothetical protein